MQVVSAFDFDLLSILHAIVGKTPAEQVMPILFRRQERPPCLTDTTVRLVQRTLAQGAVLSLAREGWRSERAVDGERVVSGRLWRRVPPHRLGLEFSSLSLDFLMALTADDAEDLKMRSEAAPKLGDLWLIAIAADRFAQSGAVRRWVRKALFASNGFLCLLHPEWFAETRQRPTPDFSPWLTSPGCFVLEAWQQRLAKYWKQGEHAKSAIEDLEQMQRLGTAQKTILSGFLQAVAAAERRDLARFLLILFQQLATRGLRPESMDQKSARRPGEIGRAVPRLSRRHGGDVLPSRSATMESGAFDSRVLRRALRGHAIVEKLLGGLRCGEEHAGGKCDLRGLRLVGQISCGDRPQSYDRPQRHRGTETNAVLFLGHFVNRKHGAQPMSRAYRVTVRQSLRQVVRAGDQVQSQLDLLEILPSEEMADLLAAQLERLGFERDGKTAHRKQGETLVAVDAETGVVRVSVEKSDDVNLELKKEAVVYDDVGPSEEQVQRALKARAEQELAERADAKRQALREQATDALEAQLADLRRELDQAVNRATAAALKVKASQMGQIKHISEDHEAGSLTIILEV